MANELHDKVRRVRRMCVAVADRLSDRLTADREESLRQFIRVGEYGLFAETLCAALAKGRIAVTREEYDDLVALGTEVEGESYQPSRYLSDVVIRED